MGNKSMRQKTLFVFITTFLMTGCLFFVGSLAQAATLNFDPDSGSYQVGKIITVGVYVSSADQAMNAVIGTISFPADKLEVVSISKIGSIINAVDQDGNSKGFWTKNPSYSNSDGTVKFEGVVYNPGYQGTNGRIITIIFKIKAAGSANLSFSADSKVLANDGNSTNILTSSGTAIFELKETSPPPPPPPPPPLTPPPPPLPPLPAPENGGGTPSPTPEPAPIPPPSIINIPETVQTAVQDLKAIVNTPIGSVATKVVSTAGVLVGAFATASAVVFAPTSLSELFLVPMRLISLLMFAFGLKKRTRPWGVVYDSVTKQPLDPAYVILKDLQGKQIATAITDLDGRYGFLVGPGTYIMEANKTNYTFPSKKLAGKTRDELYDNLYFDNKIEITKEGEVIAKNIPLDPIKFDWNEFAKRDKNFMKFYSKWDVLMRKSSDMMFPFGFIIAIIAFFVAPYPYNSIILGLYLFLLLLRVLGIKPKPLGHVVYKSTGMPLSFGIMRVMIPGSEIEVAHKIIDAYGRYYCLVPNGKYYIRIENKNSDGSYSLVYTSLVVNTLKNGIIKEVFKI